MVFTNRFSDQVNQLLSWQIVRAREEGPPVELTGGPSFAFAVCEGLVPAKIAQTTVDVCLESPKLNAMTGKLARVEAEVAETIRIAIVVR